MFERTLKDLANRHFEVIWRYENMTNSIMVRLEKRFDHQWYKLERRIGFEDLMTSNMPLFEFCMVQILKGMVSRPGCSVVKWTGGFVGRSRTRMSGGRGE